SSNRSVITILNNQLFYTDTSAWDTNASDDITQFKNLTDVNISSFNNVVSQSVVVNSTGTGLTFVDTSLWDKNESDDVKNFYQLNDVAVTSYNNVAGYYLQVKASGHGITFIDPATVGFGNASLLGGLSSSQFLRSDASSTISSGILSFSVGTTLNIDSGSVLNIQGALKVNGGSLGQLATLDQVGSGQVKNLALYDYHFAPSAAVSWSKISKTGSSLSDLDVRSASDLSSGQLGPAFYDAYENLNYYSRFATSNSSASTTLLRKNYADSTYLNASNISSGTLSSSVVSGAYTGITGLGTLSTQLVGGTASFNGTVTVNQLEFLKNTVAASIALNTTTAVKKLIFNLPSDYTYSVSSGQGWEFSIPIAANSTATFNSTAYFSNKVTFNNDVTFNQNIKVAGKVYGTLGDYAEYLEQLNYAEKIGAADLVGVVGGKISHTTTHAQRAMVISSAPFILGNSRIVESGKKSLPVAFIGQVPVRVIGSVASGDLIVPSGRQDGTGVAVNPDAVSADQLNLIVGEAWESSDDVGEKQINVGILPPDQTRSLLAIFESRTRTLLNENTQLKSEIEALKTSLNEIKQRLR
ncbi:hypothetical protein EB093_08870, partial [bacterium]|nr:hypothetical protein [bacterium]